MGRYKELLEPFKSHRNSFLINSFQTPLAQAVTAGLTHSNNVAVVNNHDQSHILPNIDGLITFVSHVPLLVSTQDCVPVFLWDEEKTFVGALHAGWRGVINEILPNALKILQEKKIILKNVHIAFGPSIRQCHFEVQEDVATLFEPRYKETISKRNNKIYIDLIAVLTLQAITAGVPQKNINKGSECSFCTEENSKHKYFSWRRDKVTTNNSISVIELVK